MRAYSKTKWILIPLLLVLMGAAYFALRSKSSDGALARTGKVTRGELVQRVTIAGSVEPAKTTIVTAPYDGYIKKIYVKLGSRVKSGDPLMSIAQSLHSNESVFPVRAPFDGVVTQVLKSEGQFVKASDSKEFVLRIDDISKMYVQASAPEIDFVKIKEGLPAVVKLSAILTRAYKGVVGDIAQSPTNKEQFGQRSQVDYMLKIFITDADSQMKPGMTAVVDIITSQKSDVLMLAHEYIYKDAKAYYVISKLGQKIPVEVGLQNETDFEITKGLVENQEIQQVDFAKLNKDK